MNARQGEVQIPAHLKPLFREHSDQIDILTDRQQPLEFKRQILISSGGGADGGKRQKKSALPIVVPLLATVLGSLGGEFISRILRRNNDGDQ